MRKYANSALVYAILAMVGGVFYREFTKFNGFTGTTSLGFVHAHYFALGMIGFLHRGPRAHRARRKHRADPSGREARGRRCGVAHGSRSAFAVVSRARRRALRTRSSRVRLRLYAMTPYCFGQKCQKMTVIGGYTYHE